MQSLHVCMYKLYQLALCNLKKMNNHYQIFVSNNMKLLCLTFFQYNIVLLYCYVFLFMDEKSIIKLFKLIPIFKLNE